MPTTVDLIDEIQDQELGPTQSVMAVIDQTGDTKTIWDRTKPDEVAAARETFKALKAKGYIAYHVKSGRGDEGQRGEVMPNFDPEAERMILSPKMVGG